MSASSCSRTLSRGSLPLPESASAARSRPDAPTAWRSTPVVDPLLELLQPPGDFLAYERRGFYAKGGLLHHRALVQGLGDSGPRAEAVLSELANAPYLAEDVRQVSKKRR
jgi:hypothetical protein